MRNKHARLHVCIYAQESSQTKKKKRKRKPIRIRILLIIQVESLSLTQIQTAQVKLLRKIRGVFLLQKGILK